MILIGQYDSPFVRRVAIAMHLYAMPYEHTRRDVRHCLRSRRSCKYSIPHGNNRQDRVPGRLRRL